MTTLLVNKLNHECENKGRSFWCKWDETDISFYKNGNIKKNRPYCFSGWHSTKSMCKNCEKNISQHRGSSDIDSLIKRIEKLEEIIKNKFDEESESD